MDVMRVMMRVMNLSDVKLHAFLYSSHIGKVFASRVAEASFSSADAHECRRAILIISRINENPSLSAFVRG
jgi:hypothetical protein